MLLAWLTKPRSEPLDVHLSPVAFAPGQTATMNFVVCVHEAGERLAWRISDFEKLEYFSHLPIKHCSRGLSREDKMALLADLAAKLSL